MNNIYNVVLLTRDSEFKKYNGDTGNMFEKAKRFANKLQSQQPDETFCVIELSPKCYIVCRIITDEEYTIFFVREIADVETITENKILYKVGKENT